MRGYDVFLISLAVCACLSFGTGDLVIGLFFSIIGIPLAFLILLLPALALVLGLARILDLWLLSRVLPAGKSGFAAIGVALLLLAGVSLTANQRQSAERARLLADDHDDLSRPLPDQVYALLSKEPSTECTDFCQRLLLTGQATAVLLAQSGAQGLDAPDPTMPATLWQIKDQPTCPPVALPVGAARMLIRGENAESSAKADVLIGEGLAAGHCLIATASTLAAADVVIVEATLREADWDPGFSFGGDLISAKRYAVWLKSDRGLVEQARWTYVSARQMFPLAVPVVEPGMNTKTKIGFARMRTTGYAYDPGFGTFADQMLGLRLALTAVAKPVLPTGEDPLLAALKRPGPLAANIAQLADARVNAISVAETTGPEDRAVFTALLADPRVTLQWWYEPAIRSLLQDSPPDFAATVAGIGFSRLSGLLLPDQGWDKLSQKDKYALLKRVNPVKQQIGFIGAVLAQLPDAALQPYRPAIFALAKDRENRTEPYKLLIHLNAFGAPGARALVDLLADADRFNTGDPFFRNHWKHAYLAAMTGLCQMGPQAASVLPDVLGLVNSGTLILSGGASHGQKSAVMLIRLGQPADTILGLAEREQYPMSSKDLDLAVRRAATPEGCAF